LTRISVAEIYFVLFSSQMEEKAKNFAVLMADCEKSKIACEELEELNSSWAKQNLELSLNLQEVKV